MFLVSIKYKFVAVLYILLWLSPAIANPSQLRLCTELLNEHLAQYLSYPQPPTAIVNLTVNRIHGMTWESASKLRWPHHPQNKTLAELHTQLKNPLLQYAAHTDRGAWFEAHFSVLPIEYFSRPLDDWLGIPRGGYVFNMSLADHEMSQNFKSMTYPHLQDSFAYIRFYIKGEDLVVTEIQSELYRHARKKNLGEQYSKWSKQILLAFEDYALKKFFPQHPNGRIIIAGAEYQMRRWRGIPGERKLSPDLARLLYRDLPVKLGYNEVDISLAIENPGHIEGEEGLTPEPIKKGFAIPLTQIKSSTFPPNFLNVDYNIEHQTKDFYKHIMNFQKESLWAKKTLVAQSPAYVVTYKKIPDSLLFGENLGLKVTHEKLLKQLPAWVSQLDQQTVISGGSAKEEDVASGSINVNQKKYDFEQWPNSDRHPFIRPQSSQSGDALTLKGGGRRTLEGQEKLSPSIFAVKKTGTESHRVWGGLLESQAIVEFINHLKLFEYGHSVGFTPSLAIPFDVGWMEQFPRLNQKNTTLVSAQSYFTKELAKSPERIAQLRFWARNPHRVSVAVFRFTGIQLELFLKPILEQTYSSYGEKFIWIKPPVSLIDSDVSSDAKYFSFLRALYEKNKMAADRISHEFAKRTLQTIGFVHGLGGHFGGSPEQFLEDAEGNIVMLQKPLGAPMGGSTQFRNVDLAGELRDLDNNVFIPGTNGTEWANEITANKNFMRGFQKYDLQHWQETYHQFKALIMGKLNPPEGIVFPTYTYGDPEYGQTIRLVPIDYAPGGELRRHYLDEDYNSGNVFDSSQLKFKDQVLQNIYQAGFDLGQRARH